MAELYRFQGTCQCEGYTAKPKSRFATTVLGPTQLEELQWMVESHIDGKGCGSIATLTDPQIACYLCSSDPSRDGVSVEWTRAGGIRMEPVAKRARTSKTNLVEDAEPLLKDLTYKELTELNFKLASEFLNRSRLLE